MCSTGTSQCLPIFSYIKGKTTILYPVLTAFTSVFGLLFRCPVFDNAHLKISSPPPSACSWMRFLFLSLRFLLLAVTFKISKSVIVPTSSGTEKAIWLQSLQYHNEALRFALYYHLAGFFFSVIVLSSSIFRLVLVIYICISCYSIFHCQFFLETRWLTHTFRVSHSSLIVKQHEAFVSKTPDIIVDWFFCLGNSFWLAFASMPAKTLVNNVIVSLMIQK